MKRFITIITLAVVAVACATTGRGVMGTDGKPQTSIEVPIQGSTTLATQRVINAAVSAGFRVESTSQGVITLAPKVLNQYERVMLRANITGSDSSSIIVAHGTYTNSLYDKPDQPVVISHWVVSGRPTDTWIALEKFANAIREAK